MGSPAYKNKESFYNQFPNTNSFLETKIDVYDYKNKTTNWSSQSNWDSYEKFLMNKQLEINLQIDCCDNPNVVRESGCKTCKSCGWGACVVA